MNRDYKLNNSRTKLPRMNHSQILNNNFKKTKDGTLKPKVHLRYGRLSDIKNKGTLISTIIEEHLLKFGFLMTYDHYIKEYAMRNAFKKDAEEKFFKLSEIKDIIIKSSRRGDLRKTLTFWERLIKRVQCTKPSFKRDERMEFKLRAFLAIYFLHPFSGNKIVDEDRIVELTAKRLENFNQFLGEKGSQFIEDEEFTAYFSIPYLLTSDEDETERLKDVFSEDWITHLFEDLEKCMEDMTENMEEEDGRKTLLEDMAEYFIKNSTKEKRDIDLLDHHEEFEGIEQDAQDITDEIHNLEEMSHAKKFEMNMLANKYEMLKKKYAEYVASEKDRLRSEPWLSLCSLLIPIQQNTLFLKENAKVKKTRELEAREARSRGVLLPERHQVVTSVFRPYDKEAHHLRLAKLWKKCHADLLDKAFGMIELIEEDKKDSHQFKQLKLDVIQTKEYLSQSESDFGVDPEAPYIFAGNLGVDEDANIERRYEIKEEEIKDKIIKGDAYDSEAILCYLLKNIKADSSYEFEGIEDVVIYAFEKFGEMRDEFLDPDDIRSEKFEDREFTYDLMTAFLYYMCTREDVRHSLRSDGFIVVTFNQFQDFVDANDNLLQNAGILEKMNVIIYRVLHLIKDSYLGVHNKINDEQFMKNLVNLVLNQDTYQIPERYKEEVLSVLYTLIYMNSGVFDTLLDFHVKSLCEGLRKELTKGRGRIFNIIVILLLNRLSPHHDLKKVKGLEELVEDMMSTYEDDRHFMWLYSLGTDSRFRIDERMMTEMDVRMESIGFEMAHNTIQIDENLAEERLWYFERKSIVEKTLELEKMKAKEDQRKSEKRKSEFSKASKSKASKKSKKDKKQKKDKKSDKKKKKSKKDKKKKKDK